MDKENIESIYPLSPMQEGMLFHSIYDKESKVYVVVMHFSLHGALNVSAFKRAWQKVTDRHAVLRTFFIWKNRETPLQIVPRRVELPWQEYDWRDKPASEQSERLRSYAEEDRKKGFHLSKAPLMRLTLIQTSHSDYHFFFSHHHMLFDGWSAALLLKEVFTVYQANCSGKDISLKEPEPYKTYITWLKQQNLSEAERYWRKTLQGFTQPTPVTLDEALGSTQSAIADYDEQYLTLSKTTTSKLQLLAQQHQITLSTLIQGVWALLLSKYSGETDVVFGTVVSGRSIALPGIESMIGLFINAQPVRVQTSPQASLMPWLKELQKQQLRALKFEHSSLRNIQAWSELVRSYGQSLFNSILVFGNYPLNDFIEDVDEDLEIGKLSFLEGSNYPLTVLVDPSETLTIRISYDTHYFNNTTIFQRLEQVQTLLEAFADNPYQHLSAFSLLSEEKKHQVLTDFNQTKVSYPIDKTIIQFFEAQAAKTPEAVAIQYGQDYLNYAQLNRRANQLAHFLQKMGVGQETLVGVFMERSLEMVISLYGIMKAGGAYVPLDPEYPAERLAFMLQDTEVSVLLTQAPLTEKLSTIQNSNSDSRDLSQICLDSEWEVIASESTDNPVNGANAENLAYVIYTSGSTGRPKGVMNEHRGICNRLLWMQDAYSLTREDRVLQKTPFSFDVSVWEFFWPLMFGARLVIAKPGGHRDSEYLVKLIVEHKITTLHFVPSMLQAFLLNDNVETCQSLKRVICSGEALPYSLQERFFSCLEAELHNLYGPTEAAVDVTYWACHRESKLSTVPIGRPVANTQIYLLDTLLQPVPIGVPGELHIGGVQVARGYLNRPELTTEKFIPDPFSSDSNARLYKTGDLARYLPDGNILYLGRLDFQVKIRGNRIELGEIEATLSQHPSIREAVVVAQEYDLGDKRLAAYVVPKHEQSISISHLRDFLSKKLPDYMIPASYTVLETIPLTPNGKVDRKALPIPELDRSTLASDFVAPRNTAEESLANIWAQVIGVERVGINDNFFDLGGDSIISLQIVAKASQAGLRLIPQQLFEYQTISELSSVIEIADSITAEQGLISGSVPLTPIQHWFFEQSISDRNYWNQSAMIDVLDELNPKLLEQAIQQLLTHHDALRLQFSSDTSTASYKWKQSVNQAVPTIDFEVIDISDLPHAEQQQIVETTTSRLEARNNLGRGKLVKAAYFKRGLSQPSRLFITIHHLAVDAISWPILVQDVETVYNQLVLGKPIALPAKTTSFKAWAEKLNEFAQTEALKQELDYWTAVSDKVTGDLPIDTTAGVQNKGLPACTISVSLTLEETLSLLESVPSVYNTQINDVLLTALAQTIKSWTNQTSLFINLKGHGREEIIQNVDLSRTTGWFTTIFPAKLTLPDSSNPSEAIKSIKEQLRRIPNRGIGYGMLRYLCHDEAVTTKLSTSPKPQILFNYLDPLDRLLPDSALFRFAEPLEDACSLGALHSHLLEINMKVIRGCLRIDWKFNQKIHHRQTIQQLADNYAKALRTLIAHILSPNEAGGFTPSDFPLANLDEDKINQIANILKEPE